jgi:hypothetical protein
MARKIQKTERHVVVCAFVVEVPEGTDMTDTEPNGVIPGLVEEVDEHFTGLTQRNGNGRLHYSVIDVTMFTERGFMWEARKHGFPRQFPDVYVDGPPPPMTIKRIRSAPRPKKRIKKKLTLKETA